MKKITAIKVQKRKKLKKPKLLPNPFTSNENEVEENNSLVELSSLWSSQISITTTKKSIITKGPVNYTDIKK